MDRGKNHPLGICNYITSYFKNLQIKSKINILDVEQQKICVFSKESTWHKSKLAQAGGNWSKKGF